jgi:hypothetical protein
LLLKDLNNQFKNLPQIETTGSPFYDKWLDFVAKACEQDLAGTLVENSHTGLWDKLYNPDAPYTGWAT